MAYSLTAWLFSVFVSTLNVFNLNIGLIGPSGLLYLLYVRYLFADWLDWCIVFSDGIGDIDGVDASTMF